MLTDLSLRKRVLLIFAGLLIIVSIDHAFAGTVHVGPEALELVLSDFHAQR